MNAPRIILAGVPEALTAPLGARLPRVDVVRAATVWDLMVHIAKGDAALLVLGRRICGVSIDAVLREAYTVRRLAPVPAIAIRDDAGQIERGRETLRYFGAEMVLAYPLSGEELAQYIELLLQKPGVTDAFGVDRAASSLYPYSAAGPSS